MNDTFLMFSTTLGSAAVVAALAMVYYSLKGRSELHKNHKMAHEILTGLVFGLLSVYCSLSAVRISDVQCNCRDLPVIYAGMVAGPISGIIAGVIGAGFRYFVSGGPAALACALGCLSATAVGCILHVIIKKYYKYNVLIGVIGAVVAESIHLFIGTLFGFSEGIRISAFPMIFANAAGMAFCMYMYNCCKPDLRK